MNVRQKLIKIENWFYKKIMPIIKHIIDASPISMRTDSGWQFTFKDSSAPRCFIFYIWMYVVQITIDINIPRFIHNYMVAWATKKSNSDKIPCSNRSWLTNRCINQSRQPTAPDSGQPLNSFRSWRLVYTERECDNCNITRRSTIPYAFIETIADMNILTEDWSVQQDLYTLMYNYIKLKYSDTSPKEIK